MEGPISFWGYKEQESNLIFSEHDDDDDDDDDDDFNILKLVTEKQYVNCGKMFAFFV